MLSQIKHNKTTSPHHGSQPVSAFYHAGWLLNYFDWNLPAGPCWFPSKSWVSLHYSPLVFTSDFSWYFMIFQRFPIGQSVWKGLTPGFCSPDQLRPLGPCGLAARQKKYKKWWRGEDLWQPGVPTLSLHLQFSRQFELGRWWTSWFSKQIWNLSSDKLIWDLDRSRKSRGTRVQQTPNLD